MRNTFLAIAIGMIAFTVNGQSLNLDDLIQCHKKNKQELTSYLKSKSSLWKYDASSFMWTYDSGGSASFIRKTEGTFYESEIILITNNRNIPKTILENIESYNMKNVEGKRVYVGKNYAVGFVLEENNYGEMIYSIHVMTKKMFNGNLQ